MTARRAPGHRPAAPPTPALAGFEPASRRSWRHRAGRRYLTGSGVEHRRGDGLPAFGAGQRRARWGPAGRRGRRWLAVEIAARPGQRHAGRTTRLITRLAGDRI